MGLFTDALTLFLWSLFGLAVLEWEAWLEVPSSHMRTYTVASIITITYVHYYKQCCGSEIIFFGSGFESGSGSGLFMKNTLEIQMI
jgi:hypothetical protein